MPRKKQRLIYKYRLSTLVWAIITTAIIVALIVAIILSVAMKNEANSSTSPTNIDNPNTTDEIPGPTEENKAKLSKGAYFLLEDDGDNEIKTALNLKTQKSTPLPALSDYSVKNFQDIAPEYLIIEKNRQLFSYNIKKQELNSQPIISAGEFELLTAASSISESDKFLIEIYKYDQATYQGGMAWELSYNDVDTYIYDAKKSEIVTVRNVEYGACHKLDSKYNRYFVWSCGEGIGSVLPLLTVDLTTGATREVLDSQVFYANIIDARLLDSMYRISYYDGYFVSTSYTKDNMGKIMVVDARTKDIIVREYDFTSEAMNQFNSVAIGPIHQFIFHNKDKTLLFIDSNSVVLLQIKEGKISAVAQIPSKNIHTAYTYVFDGQIYFLNTTASETKLNVLDIKNGKVDTIIPVDSVSSFGFWDL